MPRIAAALGVFATLTFCVGFNAVQYPAVWKMVAAPAQSTRPAKPAAPAVSAPPPVAVKAVPIAEPQRDFYRLVTEFFGNPLYTGLYLAFMIWLAFHLRHGFWSAFQSLGVNSLRFSNALYVLSLVLAFLLGLGYLGIPVYICIGKLLKFPWMA